MAASPLYKKNVTKINGSEKLTHKFEYGSFKIKRGITNTAKASNKTKFTLKTSAFTLKSANAKQILPKRMTAILKIWGKFF